VVASVVVVVVVAFGVGVVAVGAGGGVVVCAYAIVASAGIAAIAVRTLSFIFVYLFADLILTGGIPALSQSTHRCKGSSALKRELKEALQVKTTVEFKDKAT
jgi:hypothetical protein